METRGKNAPLTIEVVDGELVIRGGVSTLPRFCRTEFIGFMQWREDKSIRAAYFYTERNLR